VERSDNIAWSGDDGSAISSTRYPTSGRLLAAIHRGEEAAIRELFLLYAPLLREQARLVGVDADQRDEVVTTLLDDVVLHLMENALAPRHLAKYLVAALRNRARTHRRDGQRRRLTQDRAYVEVGFARQRIVAESQSTYGIRASLGANDDGSLRLRSGIAKLAQSSARDLTPDETTMMVAVGRHMPLRDIAEQLGISYGAARVRLHRLRERFRKLASQYMITLKPEEKREIERFFRRAEVRLVELPLKKLDTRAVVCAKASKPEKNNGKA
jgi:DNA-directed RNA polymerase specialized sigma24 family protein